MAANCRVPAALGRNLRRRPGPASSLTAILFLLAASPIRPALRLTGGHRAAQGGDPLGLRPGRALVVRDGPPPLPLPMHSDAQRG